MARMIQIRSIETMRTKALETIARIKRMDPVVGAWGSRIFEKLTQRLTGFKIAMEEEHEEDRATLGLLSAERIRQLQCWVHTGAEQVRIRIPPADADWRVMLPLRIMKTVMISTRRLEHMFAHGDWWDGNYHVWCARVVEEGELALGVRLGDREVMSSLRLFMPAADGRPAERLLRRVGLREAVTLLAPRRDWATTVFAVTSWKREAAKRMSDCDDFLDNETVRSLAEGDYAGDLRDCVTVREFLTRLAEITGDHFPNPDDDFAGRGPAYEANRWAGSDSSEIED